MKRLAMILASMLLVSFTAGCGGGTKRVALPPGVSTDIAVLALGADTTGLNADQVALLQQSLTWMDRDIIRSLTRRGFNAALISNGENFNGNGHLLTISITKHKMIPKGARFMAGMMAGADVLAAHYELANAGGKTVLSWDDSQASTKGGTYCAQTLNRNATQKIASFLSGN